MRSEALRRSLTIVRRDTPRRRRLSVERAGRRGAGVVTHAVFLGLLVAALTLCAALVPPASARVDRAEVALENDRSIKLTLIDRLKRSPEILVVGSSRGRHAEPTFIETLTGRTGFNAAVTGGDAPDAWVMTRYMARRFPSTKRRYLWFLDVGIAGDTVNPQLAADPRAARYLGLTGGGLAVARQTTLYKPDGSINYSSLPSVPDSAERLRTSVERLVASIRANPPAPSPTPPKQRVYFERTLAYMNRHGARPVLVLNPIYPTVLAELERFGFPGRQAALEYLAALRSRFDFVLVDCEDISRWGGSPTDFVNATHVNRANMRRMLRYVVAHSKGALR